MRTVIDIVRRLANVYLTFSYIMAALLPLLPSDDAPDIIEGFQRICNGVPEDLGRLSETLLIESLETLLFASPLSPVCRARLQLSSFR